MAFLSSRIDTINALAFANGTSDGAYDRQTKEEIDAHIKLLSARICDQHEMSEWIFNTRSPGFWNALGACVVYGDVAETASRVRKVNAQWGNKLEDRLVNTVALALVAVEADLTGAPVNRPLATYLGARTEYFVEKYRP